MSSEENKLNIQNITQELHELNLLLSLEDTQLITVLDQLPTSETNYKTLQLKINPYFTTKRIFELLPFIVGKNKEGEENRRSKFASAAAKLLASGKSEFINFFFNSSLESDSKKIEPVLRTSTSQGSDTYSETGDFQRVIEIGNEQIEIPIFKVDSEILLKLNYLLTSFEEENPTAHSYVCMVLESFFDSPKNIVQAFRFLYSDYSNVDCILKNIGNSSICNLLRNCLVGVKVSDATSDDRVSSNVLYYRVDIVNSIAEIMLASDVEEEVENCSIILKQLLWDRQIILDAGYLIRMVILDSKGFTKLIDRICSSKNSRIRRDLLSVAQEIILYCIYTDTAQTPSSDNYSPPTTNGANSRKMSADFILVHVNSDLEKKEAILMLLIEGLISQLVDCLPSSLDSKSILITSSGASIRCVGADVLVLAKTLASLYILDTDILSDIFLKTDFVEKLQNLFFGNHTNSLIHNIYKDVILSALSRLNKDCFLQLFREEGLLLKFTRKVIECRDSSGFNPKPKDRPMYYVHAVMIGENLQRIWKQQNYVGVEATSYFASEEWKTFLDRIIKPEIAVFDKVLGGKVPKRVLQQKASLEFNDYSENGSFSGLDDELTCPEEQSHHLRIDEEQSPFLTPGSLSVSNISRSQNKHDIEDILRESSPRNLPSPRFNK